MQAVYAHYECNLYILTGFYRTCYIGILSMVQ